MASTIYEFPSFNGMVQVEVDAPGDQGPVAVGRDEVAVKAQKSFDEAMAGIRPIAEGILAQTSGLGTLPKEVQVKFGIKLSGKLGAILASTSAEAHIEIALTWKGDDG
ncbi:MAG: CU044_2847 family protein [Sedimentitalea sp.]|uniref:CU044_2847 family protein n=1 Tax=Sedimentitalea sp. TaxID=2048915 RepID=UPI0032632D08